MRNKLVHGICMLRNAEDSQTVANGELQRMVQASQGLANEPVCSPTGFPPGLLIGRLAGLLQALVAVGEMQAHAGTGAFRIFPGNCIENRLVFTVYLLQIARAGF